MKTILVIEYNPQVLQFFGVALNGLGYHVLLAGNREEALEIYRSEPVHFVLLDMPGTDGPETLAAIKAIDPQAVCCMMSTSDAEYCPGDTIGLLQQPFFLESLRKLIDDNLRD